jgi:hypothetical protein
MNWNAMIKVSIAMNKTTNALISMYQNQQKFQSCLRTRARRVRVRVWKISVDRVRVRVRVSKFCVDRVRVGSGSGKF